MREVSKEAPMPWGGSFPTHEQVPPEQHGLGNRQAQAARKQQEPCILANLHSYFLSQFH